MPALQVKLNLTKAQLNKIKRGENIQLSKDDITKEGNTNVMLSSKLATKFKNAFKKGSGIRLKKDDFNLVDDSDDDDDDDDEYEIIGDGFFKKIDRTIRKSTKKIKNVVDKVDKVAHEVKSVADDISLTKARKALYKKANALDKRVKKEVTEKKVKSVAIKAGKYAGKEAVKYVAREGISGVLAVPLTMATGNPVLSGIIADETSNQIMKRTGADRKIDKAIQGLGFKGYEKKGGSFLGYEKNGDGFQGYKEGNGIQGYKQGGSLAKLSNANGWPLLVGDGSSFIARRMPAPSTRQSKSGDGIKNFVYSDANAKSGAGHRKMQGSGFMPY